MRNSPFESALPKRKKRSRPSLRNVSRTSTPSRNQKHARLKTKIAFKRSDLTGLDRFVYPQKRKAAAETRKEASVLSDERFVIAPEVFQPIPRFYFRTTRRAFQFVDLGRTTMAMNIVVF